MYLDWINWILEKEESSESSENDTMKMKELLKKLQIDGLIIQNYGKEELI